MTLSLKEQLSSDASVMLESQKPVASAIGSRENEVWGVEVRGFNGLSAAKDQERFIA